MSSGLSKWWISVIILGLVPSLLFFLWSLDPDGGFVKRTIPGKHELKFEILRAKKPNASKFLMQTLSDNITLDPLKIVKGKSTQIALGEPYMRSKNRGRSRRMMRRGGGIKEEEEDEYVK